MSDMKCPFCNGELVGTIGHPICRNQDCVMCDDPMPQDLLEELIRTRKALDVAVDALKSAHDYYEHCIQRDYVGDDINWDCTAFNMELDISEAIEQIESITKGDK